MPASRVMWILLSVLSAVLLNLTFPYPGISHLAWIALVPFFIVILTEKGGKVFFSALITGFLFNIVYILWMKEYKHPASLPGGVFGEMVFFCFAVLLSWFLSRSVRRWKPLALALSWLSVDYIKTIGFLGFPWGILGYSQYENLALIQSASILGVWGVDFLILYANGLLAFFIAGSGGHVLPTLRAKVVPVSVFAALLALSLVYGGIAIKREDRLYETKRTETVRSPTARVALIQANFDPWSPRLAENLQGEMELTRRALEKNPDLVVWSESSVPFPYEFHLKRNNRYARQVHEFIVSTGKPFLFGTLEFEGVYLDNEYEGDFYNVAVFYSGGKLAGSYRKIHLVPFGEWFPFERIFPFVTRILQSAGAGDFVPGTEYTVFDAGGFGFNVLICFEDVFGELARRFIARGRRPEGAGPSLGKPGLIINVTNDAWTGSRKAELQHFSISIFRAIENRRGFARAANGGVTACVNTCGEVIDSLEMFTSGYLVCDVPVASEETLTFYSKFGDLPIRIVVILVGASLLAALLKKLIDRSKKPRIM